MSFTRVPFCIILLLLSQVVLHGKKMIKKKLTFSSEATDDDDGGRISRSSVLRRLRGNAEHRWPRAQGGREPINERTQLATLGCDRFHYTPRNAITAADRSTSFPKRTRLGVYGGYNTTKGGFSIQIHPNPLTP